METNIIKGFKNQPKIDTLKQVLDHLSKAYIIIKDEDLRDTENEAYNDIIIDSVDETCQAIISTSNAISNLISWDLSGVALGYDLSEIEEPDDTQSKKMEIVHKTKKTA